MRIAYLCHGREASFSSVFQKYLDLHLSRGEFALSLPAKIGKNVVVTFQLRLYPPSFNCVTNV